jgi:protein ImuB
MRPEPGTPRVLAICVPRLALQRVLRSRPERGALAVVHEGVVLHGNPPARGAGVQDGDSIVQARAACAGLVVVEADPAADRAALRGLAEAAMGLAPAVEVAPPDAVLLDAGGARLAGQDAEVSERSLAERALALSRDLGWRVQLAVASGKGPALALARHAGRDLVHAPSEGTAAALAGLPLGALGLPPAVAGWLEAVGVTDVGGLARLPPETLGHRFGAAGVEGARRARGEDPRPLVPFAPETFPREAWDFAGTEVGVLTGAEPVTFAAKRLADRVAARLAGRGMGASRLRLTLRLDPRGEERLDLPLARPSAEAGLWMVPLRERLAALRLPAPVRGLELSVVEAAEVPAEQLSAGDRPEVARALEVTLARLAARLGDGAVFAAEAADRHRPEAAYRAAPFGSGPAARGRGGAAGGNGEAGAGTEGEARPEGEARGEGAEADGTRPTRLLRAPRPVVAEGEGGRLTALRLEGQAHAVLALAGPERIAGEWWGAPFDRDYYRVRLEGLGDLWIYRDGRDGRLWLHGVFD